MAKTAGIRVHTPEHSYWKLDLYKGAVLKPGMAFYWDPWGTVRPDETYIVSRLSARIVAGDREGLRPAASDMLVKIQVEGDTKWSRDLEHVVLTPLTEELETRIHRMELVLNWLMREETTASRTLQRLGAKPLNNVPLTLAPGHLIIPVHVSSRQNLRVAIYVDREATIPADITISFELHAVHSHTCL